MDCSSYKNIKTKSQTVMDQVRERMMKNNHGRQLVFHTQGNQRRAACRDKKTSPVAPLGCLITHAPEALRSPQAQPALSRHHSPSHPVKCGAPAMCGPGSRAFQRGWSARRGFSVCAPSRTPLFDPVLVGRCVLVHRETSAFGHHSRCSRCGRGSAPRCHSPDSSHKCSSRIRSQWQSNHVIVFY